MNQEQALNESINAGIEIKQMLESSGWKRAQQLLDKMITDTIGGKIGDKWCATAHKFSKPMELTHTDIMFLLGYRQGLVEFSNTLRGVVASAERANNMKNEAPQSGEAYPYGNLSS